MWYLVAMEICVMLFLLVRFFICYSIGPINVCTNFEINRYKIDEVRKYAKIVFYLIYLTSCDAKTVCHTSWGLRPEVSTASGLKVMAQIVVFVFSVTLTFTYVQIFCHTHCA